MTSLFTFFSFILREYSLEAKILDLEVENLGSRVAIKHLNLHFRTCKMGIRIIPLPILYSLSQDEVKKVYAIIAL